MAEVADVQKALEQQRAERHRAEQERRQLVQRSGREAKMRTQMDLAKKRAKKVKTLDLCFVVDLTASMQWWLKTVSDKMEEIIHDNLERMGDFAKVRVAIVGYRDYDDKEHLLVHPFTTEVGKIKAFLDGLEAEGGGDQCEDVLTGLEEALKLDWSSTGKVLYLLSQTPNHGWRFHSDFQVSSETSSLKMAAPEDDAASAEWLATQFYDLHAEDTRQWQATDAALQELQKKGIQMVILRLGSATDKMIEVFKQQYGNNSPGALKVHVFDPRKDAKRLRCIVSGSSVASYGSSISKLSQAKAIQCKRMSLTMDPSPPVWDRWDTWHSVEAKLYTYFMEDVDEPPKKKVRSFQAFIAPQPFGKGAMRFAFYVVDKLNPHRQHVGKVYQFDDREFQNKSAYEGDMCSQAVAAYLAKEFSLRYPESPIEFVKAELLDLGEDTPFPFRYMAIEPFIPGEYEKKTSNAGHIAKDSDLAQAFSHFTWDVTEGEIMVVDIQGVKNTLTDPQIHSGDIDRFGRGNLSCKGMDAFFCNHVCNDICQTLKLQPNPHQPASVLPDEFSRVLGSIGEDEVPEDNVELVPQAVDWMPMRGTALSLFLDAVRQDAQNLISNTSSVDKDSGRDCLGGAVFEWKAGPQIVDVKKGSAAEKANCQADVILKLVGGKSVKQMAREEVLQLLAEENNMMVTMASPHQIQSMLKEKAPVRVVEALAELGGLKALLDEHLKDLLKRCLSEGSSSMDPRALQKSHFLDAVRGDASDRIKLQAEWHDGSHCDTLGGATFAWTSPPRVVAVAAGSPADGLVLAGEELSKINDVDVKSLPRELILEMLQACTGIQLKGGHHERQQFFDAKSGLETSSHGSMMIKWSDPPMVVSEDPACPPVMLSIDGKNVFGLSKEEILALLEAWSQISTASVSSICLLDALPGNKQTLRSKLQSDSVAVHPGFQCAGCSHKPLVGARFSCKVCTTTFCGACFKGRAHAHPPDHEFSVQDFPGSTSTVAPPAPKISEGSAVVVIGTRQRNQDGKLGLVTASLPSSSAGLPMWTVLLEDAKDDLSVQLEAQHLFLRSTAASPEVAAATPSTPPPEVPHPADKVVKSSRFTLVDKCVELEEVLPPMRRQRSLRELRQVEGHQALERFKLQEPSTGRTCTFLCKGMCGTMVEKDKHEYIKEGQLVLCDVCTQKSQASEEKTSCRKCKKEFVHSKFLMDLGELQPLCEECKEDLQWAIVSPFRPSES